MQKLITLLTKLRSLTIPQRFVFLMVLVTLLLIPFRILSFNFWPIDDVNRHVAKVISEKSWPEILVMNPEFQSLDHNGGWHFVLGIIHTLGADAETMVLFSCIGLFFLFTASGLFIFRKHPMAWVGVLAMAPYGSDTYRWMFGRPFIVSATLLLLLLGIWHHEKSTVRVRWVLSLVLFTLAGWIHGAWYLMVLVPLSFALAGNMKHAIQIGTAWLAGSFLAGILTGDPLLFLIKQFTQSLSSVDSVSTTRLLVGEFQPQMDMIPILFWVLLFFVVRVYGIPTSELKKNPGLWLAAMGWILGMINGRFWSDWGAIGYLYVTAETLSLLLEKKEIRKSCRNLCHVSMACLALFLIYSTDLNSRWSNNEFRDRLRLEDPQHTAWLPDSGGILYSDSMRIYYDTFYSNPHGEWRYMLGHEPALMPLEDQKTYREIQRFKHRVDALYDPWVDKMQVEDRLILTRVKSSQPNIPRLEWKYIAYNTWSGRLPRPATPE